MSNFTMVNLRELENMAPRFGMKSGLQSRFAREALDCKKTGMAYYRVDEGFRLPFGHRHTDQEEIYVVVDGAARMKVDDEVVELGPFDAIRVAPNATRAFEGGPGGAQIVAFGGPTREGSDAELEPGWWTD